MTPQTQRRVRTEGKALPEEILNLARETFKANKAKNAASREETNSRNALFKAMKEAGLKTFNTQAVVDGKRITLEASISAPTRVEVDVAALRKLVDEETFLAIVSATQTSVKEHAGEAVLRRCSNTTEGTENVSVKAAK